MAMGFSVWEEDKLFNVEGWSTLEYMVDLVPWYESVARALVPEQFGKGYHKWKELKLAEENHPKTRITLK